MEHLQDVSIILKVSMDLNRNIPNRIWLFGIMVVNLHKIQSTLTSRISPMIFEQ